MVNPFKSIQVKVWPDFLLAISGSSFTILLIALATNKDLPGSTLGWMVMFGGLVIFGFGAKKSHYKAHIKGIKGVKGIWVSKWNHSFLSDLFALIGVFLIIFSIAIFSGYCKPNKKIKNVRFTHLDAPTSRHLFKR